VLAGCPKLDVDASLGQQPPAQQDPDQAPPQQTVRHDEGDESEPPPVNEDGDADDMPPPDGKMPPPDGKMPPPDGKMPPPDGEMPPPDGEMPPPDGEMPPPACDEQLTSMCCGDAFCGGPENHDFARRCRPRWRRARDPDRGLCLRLRADLTLVPARAESCDPQDGALLRGGPDMTYWSKSCASDEDCPRGDPYVCDLGAGACMPRDPPLVTIAASDDLLHLPPICAGEGSMMK
jgi:hypothetical protein